MCLLDIRRRPSAFFELEEVLLSVRLAVVVGKLFEVGVGGQAAGDELSFSGLGDLIPRLRKKRGGVWVLVFSG